jgi:hypothetical protein
MRWFGPSQAHPVERILLRDAGLPAGTFREPVNSHEGRRAQIRRFEPTTAWCADLEGHGPSGMTGAMEAPATTRSHSGN